MKRLLRSSVEPKLKRAELQIVVTRADGTVEDHGTVAYYHRNPLKRAWHKLTGRMP